MAALFQDHELFVRTGGHVRFLKISARSQKIAASIVGGLILLWLVGTLIMLGLQAQNAYERTSLAARQSTVAKAEARVAATRHSVDALARDLDQRQDALESLFQAHFGNEATTSAAKGKTGAAAGKAAATATTPVSNADDVAKATDDKIAELKLLRARQDSFVAAMMQAVEQRSARARAALQAVGLNPAVASSAQGGPFIPWFQSKKKEAQRAADPAIDRLALALARMEQLEQLVVAIPSSKPAEEMSLTSGFGFRHDPFTGAAALHAGLDFRGETGSPILAASAGKISFVGQKSGYGNVVEIDHGHGLMTRYAHLSRFDVTPGMAVTAGQQIAGMGSTGRSTGTHLHFEVRINGEAIDPRRFLEVNSDVLKIQADAGQRVRAAARS